MGKFQNKTSTEANKHPYMQRAFWLNKKNHFWETDSYTSKGKQLCRDMVETKRKTLHVDPIVIKSKNNYKP